MMKRRQSLSDDGCRLVKSHQVRRIIFTREWIVTNVKAKEHQKNSYNNEINKRFVEGQREQYFIDNK